MQPDHERRTSDLMNKISSIEITIAKGFTQMVEQHKHYQSSLQDLSTDQDRIIHVLYGNGKEGLITSIAKMGQRINVIWAVISATALAGLTLWTGVLQDFIGKSVH